MLSGIFGMAGGLVLMAILVWLLPASAALALHGVIQLFSNGWRVLLHRRYVQWAILLWFAMGALAALGLFSLVLFTPSKLVILIVLGLLPGLVWLPERWLPLDASKPSQAVAAGFIGNALSLVSGVSGPVTDLFFVNTALSRHQIVATKAMMQVTSHASKVFVYGAALLSPPIRATLPPWLIVVALLASMAGTMAGGHLLDRLTDARFRTMRRWLLTAIGLTFLAQAAMLWMHGG